MLINEKKIYNKPLLVKNGCIKEITKAAGGDGSDADFGIEPGQ